MTQPTVNSSQDYGPKGFRWLTLKRIKWTDPHGKTRFWESAERRGRASSGVDGVAIIARVISSASTSPPRIIIISQFRPPINAFCLELPAGLVDEGETAGTAALRELKEETGYSGRLLSVTPLCVSDPGMSNANMQVAVVEVDLDAPENARIEQTLGDGEFISVSLAPWNFLLSWLLEQKDRDGCEIDARLFTFAMGLHEERIEALAEAESAVADISVVPIEVLGGGSSSGSSSGSGSGLARPTQDVLENNRNQPEERKHVHDVLKKGVREMLHLVTTPGYIAGVATAVGALLFAQRRRRQ